MEMWWIIYGNLRDKPKHARRQRPKNIRHFVDEKSADRFYEECLREGIQATKPRKVVGKVATRASPRPKER
jgi:hypothetical protein